MSTGFPNASVASTEDDEASGLLERIPVKQHAHDHRVQFYDDHRFLAGVVGDFISEGLVSGENVVVIATAAHRTAFCNRLQERGLDVVEARRSGQLTLLDAERTLERFMVGGQPSWERFRAAIEEVLESVQSRRPGVKLRAYGEMVDLLWQRGNGAAAIQLEELWNDLGKLHTFSLLCAYVMGNFHQASHGAAFEHICSTHSHVAPSEKYDSAAAPADLLRQLSLLEQRARALETEVAHRKQLESSLRQALEEKERTQEALRAGEQLLRQQNEELARTVRFSETFVGILGHDLRNPLSGIVTAAGLVARRVHADGSGPLEANRRVDKESDKQSVKNAEKLRTPVLRILRSAERMARMIDQLLDFTRIRLGQGLPLNLSGQDLGAVAQICLDELGGQSTAPAVTTLGDLSGTWDGDRLCQLIGNLVSNAMTHGAADTPVEVTLDGREADAVVLEVSNQGAVPAQVLRVIFEPFRGAADRKQAGSSGLGLGLFISQQIALAHQGRIEVTSSDDKGTRFMVRLPRVSRQVAPAFSSSHARREG